MSIKLPQFLDIVDEEINKMSHDELSFFIREIARKLPERQRESFINYIKNASSHTNDDKTTYIDEMRVSIKKKINNIVPILENINSGKVCLDSEYNNDYRYWEDDDDDEFMFYDRQNILFDIQTAIYLVHECLDKEMYDDGYKLSKLLFNLEVDVNGDYYDYCCSPLDFEDLNKRGLIDVNLDNFIKESAYLAYVGNRLQQRAENVYYIISHFYTSVRFEDILQVGNHELLEFDKFLPIWTDYLSKQTDKRAADLLKEAQLLIRDDFTTLAQGGTLIQ